VMRGTKTRRWSSPHAPPRHAREAWHGCSFARAHDAENTGISDLFRQATTHSAPSAAPCRERAIPTSNTIDDTSITLPRATHRRWSTVHRAPAPHTQRIRHGEPGPERFELIGDDRDAPPGVGSPFGPDHGEQGGAGQQLGGRAVRSSRPRRSAGGTAGSRRSGPTRLRTGRRRAAGCRGTRGLRQCPGTPLGGATTVLAAHRWCRRGDTNPKYTPSLVPRVRGRVTTSGVPRSQRA
jgi:hypothetical protein